MRRTLVGALLILLVGIVLAGLYARFVSRGGHGVRHGAGEIVRVARDAAVVSARHESRRRAAAELGQPASKQILFGDLHAHTTFSFDAFSISLPMYQGEGSHPPADACDFARFPVTAPLGI
jgi:hypothetical protein